MRTCETNFGDLVADALFWEAGISADDAPDAVIMQGGGIRASIHAGDITIRDAVNALPFENYLCTLKLSGAQLLEAIEAACSQTPEESVSFPQVAGMKIVVDMTVPYEQGELYPGSTTYAPDKPGSRVTIEEVAGAPFDASATYVIATSDYVCVGGGAYYACAEPAQATMKSTGYLLNEALQYFLVDVCADGVSDAYAKPQGRLTLKTE